MNNELICTPVMLPGNGPLYEGGTGLHLAPGMGIGIGNQHLYLVSEQEIKKGDWIYDVRDKHLGKHSGKSMHPDYEKAHYRKVIATTDKSLSLSLIPNSFIERWVNEQGKIDKVRLSLTENGNLWFRNLAHPEVIILPIEDRTFSREEVIDILESRENSIEGTDYNFPMKTKKWFNKHY